MTERGTHNAPPRPGPVTSDAPDDILQMEIPKYKVQIYYFNGTGYTSDTFYTDQRDPSTGSRFVMWINTHYVQSNKEIQMQKSERTYIIDHVIKYAIREVDPSESHEWVA